MYHWYQVLWSDNDYLSKWKAHLFLVGSYCSMKKFAFLQEMGASYLAFITEVQKAKSKCLIPV